LATPAEFEDWIEEALLEIPKRLRDRIVNVVFVVDEHARRARAGERTIRHGGTLLGLYEGIPLTRRAGGYQWVAPDKITIFRDAIESHGGRNPENVRQLVREVVHHEVAHYFGFSEAKVREWERKRRGAAIPKVSK
jgi:predicted Zn-dependent protease with MMP-like domain